MVDKQDVLPRLLPERARIEFHYPDKNNTIVFIPFYENPEIKESQSANYADYNPIGRAGSLYAYTGSQSRKFKVKATYTLPHLAEHPMGIARFLRYSFGNSRKEQQLLFTNIGKENSAPKSSLSHSYGAADTYRTLLLDSKGIVDEDGLPSPHAAPPEARKHRERGWEAQGGSPLMQRDFFEEEEFLIDDLTQLDVELRDSYVNQVIDTLLFFVTLFRTSTANNVEDPVLGPPILRLTHGTMYQSVPCICKSYNLAWEEEAGFDLQTLTPRRLIINVELEELRSGDFTTYDETDIIKRNNLTGWESAIASPYTIDPTNQAYNQ